VTSEDRRRQRRKWSDLAARLAVFCGLVLAALGGLYAALWAVVTYTDFMP